MSNDHQNEPDPIRSRKKWEDTLLHARTGVFLILNGLAVKDGLPSMELSIALACLNCLWVLSSLQSHKAIARLTEESTSGRDQQIVNEVLGNRWLHHQLRPTTIISRWLPILLYVGLLVRMGIIVKDFWIWLAVASAIAFPFGVLWYLNKTAKQEA